MIKGYVESINVSVKKGTKKTEVPNAEFRVNHGIVGDAHAGDWHRQVSLLGIESVKKMEDKGVEGLCNGSFAENLTTKGIDLYTLEVGTVLRIGETIQELTQIGKKCHTGCEISHQVGACIMPKEGIFTKVLKDGVVKKGDLIEVL
ncbi:MOSC domain-containing protein [Mycoplasmatota bacterium WC44]